MHHLAEPVNKHNNLCVARLGFRELSDQINPDTFPSSARDLQQLKQTSWFLIAVGFVLLAVRAFSDMLHYI